MPTYAAFVPSASTIPHTSSSLLAATPPVVSKALSQIYPFIVAVDKLFALITWTDDDPYKSFLLIIGWSLLVNYFEVFVKYFAQVGAALVVALIVYATKLYGKGTDVEPSLDTIVHTLSNLSSRINLILLPLTSLELTSRDLTRLIFTSLFMTPLYITVTQFFLSVRQIVLFTGIFVLGYHSMWARVTRAILWRWKIVRVIVFYWTGIDFNRTVGVTQQAPRGPFQGSGEEVALSQARGQSGKKHVRFTYILFENQRRWLGIGWTSNMLAYERAPWTDEFLNESSSPESFQLPDSEGTGMQWRWVDKTWKVDLTNDGALVPRSKVKLTPDPAEDDGFVFYDNMWKRPTAAASYSKYTRRRRWVRTAELVTLDDNDADRPSIPASEPVEPVHVSVSNIDDHVGSTATEEPQTEPRQRKVKI